MQIFVISLRASTERRAFQSQQLLRLGLQFQFVDAIDRHDLAEHLGALKVDQWERPLLPTEIACFLSHLQVWAHVADGAEPALILEDDALLSLRSKAFLDAVSTLSEVDHLSLEVRKRHKLLGPPQPLTDAFAFARLFQDRSGAAAYVLWPSGAQRLIKAASAKGAALADAAIANNYDLRCYQAVPAMALQSDVAEYYDIHTELNTSSYIQAHGSRQALQSEVGVAWPMKRRRIWSQLRMAGRWFANLHSAGRQWLLPDPLGFVKTSQKDDNT